MTSTPRPEPTIHLANALAADTLVDLVRELLPPPLAEYLPTQRWYGDKNCQLDAVVVDDVAVVAVADLWFALTVVSVRFADGGEPARYFLPLVFTERRIADATSVAVVEAADRRRFVADAFASRSFPSWLLEQLATEARLPGLAGEFRWQKLSSLDRHLAAARAGPARVGSAEQSNSAVLYDEVLFVKVFRRLRAGVNPDDEVTRYLASQTPFRRLPLPLGTASYVDRDGGGWPVALAQSYVPSVGDGWSFTLAVLAEIARPSAGPGEPGQIAAAVAEYASAARRLGERTGQLHRALAQPTTEPAFAPEPISSADAERWEAELISKLRVTAEQLSDRAGSLSPELRDRPARFAAQLPELERRAAGFRSLVGASKTRVHGDYHLGQVLRTPDDDWVILDFEGEPARSLAERRAKTSPLKDVAGLLRSFGYARGAALRALPAGPDRSAAARTLAHWETTVRAGFLDGYAAEAGAAAAPLVPPATAAFVAAVAAWELDKAVYEVEYELNNRPAWLDLPLDALLG